MGGQTQRDVGEIREYITSRYRIRDGIDDVSNCRWGEGAILINLSEINPGDKFAVVGANRTILWGGRRKNHGIRGQD